MKVRPTNGVSYGVKHTITASEVNTPAVAEKLELVIDTGATADGDITITIRGESQVISVLSTDTSPADVATKIAEDPGAWTGFTASVSGDTVYFDADVAGAKTGSNTIDFGTSGATSSTGITVSTLGADEINGLVEFDFRIDSNVDYKYPLVAIANIFDSGVLTNPADLSITYPMDGVVRVDGTLVEGHVIHLIAQRDSLN